ncbi:MAG: hypothetical protein JNM07_13285 [Phycisphaerae bacterium]|nr:hypothetical protein [Phycisphaerae bacterium]
MTNRALWAVVAGLAMVTVPESGAFAQVLESGFESDAPGAAPEGWLVPTPGYKAEVVEGGAFQGARTVRLAPDPSVARENRQPVGNLMRSIKADDLRGRRVALRARIRLEGGGAEGGRAQMWLRADRANGKTGLFDNMHERPITSGEWTEAVIDGNVDEDAGSLSFGLIVAGGAAAWIDAVRLENLGPAIEADAPSKDLTERGRENVLALARLLGYVRFFQPTSEASGVDWDRFAIAAVERVEDAPDATALARALNELVAPVAPGLVIWAGSETDAPPTAAGPDGATKLVGFRHFGVGIDPPKPGMMNLYRSERIEVDRGGSDDRIEPEGTSAVRTLGGGVSCRVPLTLWADRTGTLPRGSGVVARPERPEGWKPGPKDRSTRFAALIWCWNVMQHFYPYWDVPAGGRADWAAALARSLDTAAVGSGEEACFRALGELVGSLNDGHGSVSGPGSPNDRIPVEWDWADDRLIVAKDDASGELRRGDEILAIEGMGVGELYAQVRRRISAATEGWARSLALRMLSAFPTPDPATLTVRRLKGGEEQIGVNRRGWGMSASRPGVPGLPPLASGSEVAPGVVYFDMNGAPNALFEQHLNAMVRARGVIFDMRGYPGEAGVTMLRHLLTQRGQSARWLVPITRRPDGEGQEFFEVGRWDLAPAEPRIAGKVVFLTCGGAISYAESVMGIVEAYRLGEIVGEPTAGTNGNVNPFRVAGGYTITWTGMKVLKHDGSRHHGVGITPTHPVSRTAQGIAEGRDESLEAAITLLRGG